jgi:hypothetical protein
MPPSESDSGTHRQELLVITTEHDSIANSIQSHKFVEALAKTPDGVRLTRRLQAESPGREVWLWETRDPATLEDYILKYFPDAPLGPALGGGPIPAPKIMGAFGNVTPGSSVLVLGENFGDYKQGQSHLLLVGTIPYENPGAFSDPLVVRGVNTPDGEIPAIELGGPPPYGMDWADGYVNGTIPKVSTPNGQPLLTGVLDQNAYLQVVRSDGKSSNLWPVSFIAARQRLMVPGSAFHNDACSPHGWCSTSFDGWSVAAAHYADGPGIPFQQPDSGDDVYSCHLKNDFVYDSAQWGTNDGVNSGPFGGGNPEPFGEADIKLIIGWSYSALPDDNAVYALAVYAVGPAGLQGW